MRILSFLIISIYMCSASAQILVDEQWGARSNFEMKELPPANEFKGHKRLGLQMTMLGVHGLMGLNLDINFTNDFALSLGPGFSNEFQSFNIHVKKSLGGRNFIPYSAIGYSRWSSKQDKEIQRTSPPILRDKFLSSREKSTGRFVENIIYPGLGLQYLNTSGEWAGLGYFAEVALLVDIDDFLTGATAGIGTVYYF